MNTGELIRKYRKEKKMTMKDLGEIVGVSEQAISQYERGLRKVSLEILIKISSALSVSVNDLSEKKSTFSQEILKNEFIDKGISLDKVATESGVKLSELQSLYECSNAHTMDTYFKLFRYLGFDDEMIIKIVIEDSKIDCIYNNDGTDPLKNKLKKLYLGEALDINDILLGIEDADDAKFISHLFQLGQLSNTHSMENINEINQIKTPSELIDIPESVNINLAYESLVNLILYINRKDSLENMNDTKFRKLLMRTCDFIEFELFKLEKKGEQDGE